MNATVLILIIIMILIQRHVNNVTFYVRYISVHKYFSFYLIIILLINKILRE